MSQPHAPTTPPATGPAAPVAAPAGPRERKVRFGHLALAIALVAVGALGTTSLVTLVAAEGEYLALARDVDYGAELTADDLVTVRVSNPPGLSPVPAAQRNQVVGNYAAMPLATGTLLTAAQVSGEGHPAAGEARIGITLRNDRLPAQRVRAGQVLLLVDTSDGDGAEGQPTAGRTWEAVLIGVGGDGSGRPLLGSNGSSEETLDVIVPTRDAPTIATLAADNDLTVAVLPGQPED